MTFVTSEPSIGHPGLAGVGHSKGMLGSELRQHHVNRMKKGKWVHSAKLAFERYFLRKVRKGTAENIFEKYVLKSLGSERLRPS